MQRKIQDESRGSLRRLLTACNKQQFGQIRYSYDDCAMEFATATSFLFNKYTHTHTHRVSGKHARISMAKKNGAEKIAKKVQSEALSRKRKCNESTVGSEFSLDTARG